MDVRIAPLTPEQIKARRWFLAVMVERVRQSGGRTGVIFLPYRAGSLLEQLANERQRAPYPTIVIGDW